MPGVRRWRARRTLPTLKAGGIAAFVIAGAAAAGAVTYWLWPEPKSARGSIRLVPVAAENTGGVIVSGRF